jgi:hypothetical protein
MVSILKCMHYIYICTYMYVITILLDSVLILRLEIFDFFSKKNTSKIKNTLKRNSFSIFYGMSLIVKFLVRKMPLEAFIFNLTPDFYMDSVQQFFFQFPSEFHFLKKSALLCWRILLVFNNKPHPKYKKKNVI